MALNQLLHVFMPQDFSKKSCESDVTPDFRLPKCFVLLISLQGYNIIQPYSFNLATDHLIIVRSFTV